MTKVHYIKALVLGAMLSVFMAAPAWAQALTPTQIKDQVIDEATPYFNVVVLAIIGLFAVALAATLTRKVTKMGKGGVARA